MFLLIQVQAVLYTVISATSYDWVCGSTPFEIARGVSTWPCYSQKLHENTGVHRVDLVMMKRRTG